LGNFVALVDGESKEEEMRGTLFIFVFNDKKNVVLNSGTCFFAKE
jgi:hypothetical protein